MRVRLRAGADQGANPRCDRTVRHPDRQRPDRRRHRGAVVPRRRRHHRRSHRGDRPPAEDGHRARIDATNLVVAPGFIDLLGQSEFNVLVDGRAASKILQGVTTEVTGEGSSIAPVNDRHDRRRRRPNAKHFGVAQDWRTLGRLLQAARGAVARRDQRRHVRRRRRHPQLRRSARTIVRRRRPSSSAMKQLVAEAMEQGALGLSTSLQYVPDRFASTDEIVELAKVAARYGGVYFTHQRSGERAHLRIARRSVRDRRAREHPGGDLASEDRLQGELRQDARGAAPHRGGARARPRRDREPVSRTRAPRTASTRACRCGRAKAASTRRSRG